MPWIPTSFKQHFKDLGSKAGIKDKNVKETVAGLWRDVLRGHMRGIRIGRKLQEAPNSAQESRIRTVLLKAGWVDDTWFHSRAVAGWPTHIAFVVYTPTDAPAGDLLGPGLLYFNVDMRGHSLLYSW